MNDLQTRSLEIQKKNKKLRASREELLCLKCGHIWKPRVKNPKRCPECKGDWREEKIYFRH